MLSRITLILLTVFWLCMNFLLWRSEYGWRNHVGAKVPVGVVWQKMLTAPDNCDLFILHHGKDVGRCRWSANIGQELTAGKILTDGIPLEGSAQKPTGYRIQIDGSLSVPATGPNRLGFAFDIIFNTNRDWQQFKADFKFRPSRETWSLYSRASEQTLRFTMDGQDENYDHVYKFSDLQNPHFLLNEFQLPIPPQLLDSLGLPKPGQAATPALGLAWEAHSDWVTFGHTSVRAYRLQAHLFDRFHIIVMVSQVGEILRVELPDEWVLVNAQLSEL